MVPIPEPVDIGIIISLVSLSITLIVFLTKLIKALTTLEVTMCHLREDMSEDRDTLKEAVEENYKDHRRIHKRIDEVSTELGSDIEDHGVRITRLETNQEHCNKFRWKEKE